jgi:hypothetical protein
LTWTPAAHPNHGEIFEYVLEVCELPRNWRSHLKRMQPALFPNPIDPLDESEDEKWNGVGQLLSRSRAAINWCCIPTAPLQLGGAEMIWRVVGGAGWTGIYTPLYAGDLNTVKHENLQVNSAYIYRVAVKNELGTSEWTYSWPCTLRKKMNTHNTSHYVHYHIILYHLSIHQSSYFSCFFFVLCFVLFSLYAFEL